MSVLIFEIFAKICQYYYSVFCVKLYVCGCVWVSIGYTHYAEGAAGVPRIPLFLRASHPCEGIGGAS
jgi:hypothetical protein